MGLFGDAALSGEFLRHPLRSNVGKPHVNFAEKLESGTITGTDEDQLADLSVLGELKIELSAGGARIKMKSKRANWPWMLLMALISLATQAENSEP